MLNNVIIGIKEALEAAVPDVAVFHSDPTSHQGDFPIIIFNLQVTDNNDFMGGDRDIISGLVVSYFDDADKGSGSLRDLEEPVFEALHKATFEATGYSNAGFWSTERRETRVLADVNLMTCDDVFTIYGSKE